MYMNLLGYATVYKRPAILIPYLDIGNVVTAVKYRFIDKLARSDKTKRFAMLGGSMPYLFGLQHVLESDQTLLFVEGEMNAISVLQTLPRGVSVVSAGSEGNGNAALLRTLARHYKRVFIWTDQPEKARIIPRANEPARSAATQEPRDRWCEVRRKPNVAGCTFGGLHQPGALDRVPGCAGRYRGHGLHGGNGMNRTTVDTLTVHKSSPRSVASVAMEPQAQTTWTIIF